MIKRSYLVIFLCVMLYAPALAQQNWGGGVDGETLHFGFKFQYIASEYKVLKRSDWQKPFIDPYDGSEMSPLKSVASPVSPGFGLGFVSDLRLGAHANLRFTPGLVFSDILTDYEFEDPAFSVQKKVQATFVDLPIGLKLKSDRQKNFRAYFIGGARYSIDIVSKKKKDDSGKIPLEKDLKNVPNALWYEAGIGFDIYFEWFKLSPEVKFAQTVNSVLKDNDRPENPYVAPVDKLFLRNFQFSLYFE
jgi:hypothetical protein